MAHYRLERLTRFPVSIGSTNWECFPIRLLHLPEGTVVHQRLIFADIDHSGSMMTTDVDPELTEITADQAMEFGREPMERAIIVNGLRYCFLPADDAEYHTKVRMRDKWGYFQLENGPTLGLASHEELEAQVRSSGG